MINPLYDGVQLLFNGSARVVREGKLLAFGGLTETDDLLGQSLTALAAFGPHLRERHVDPLLSALILHQLQLGRGVGGEGVDGHHAGQVVSIADVVHMAQQVGKAPLQRLQILVVQLGLGNAAVMLQGPDGGHHHHGVRLQIRHTALDIQELLRSQVGAKARLCDHIVSQLQSGVGGGDGITAVGNIGKGPAVHNGRRMLQCLDQVGL